MNAHVFSELLTDIQDEYIVSAANSKSKPVRWYQISAAAACIALLIAAAFYPKLRIQTPEITEPPAEIVTTETTAQADAGTTALTVYTTVVSRKATRRTTAETVSQIVTETVTAAVTVQETVLTVPETHKQPETVPPPVTTAIHPVTLAETTDVRIQDTPETFPADAIVKEPISTLPVIKVHWSRQETALLDPQEPYIRFRFMHSTPNESAFPFDSSFDPAQQPYIIVNAETDYKNAALYGGTLTPSGLLLHFVCLLPQDSTTALHYAIPMPDGIPL